MPVPGDDANGPGNAPSGAVPPHKKQARKAFEALSEHIGEESLIGVAENVLDLPPEKRFTESWKEFGRLFGIEDMESASEDDLPEDFIDILENEEASRQSAIVAEDSVEMMRERAISAILEGEDGVPFVFMVAFLEQYEENLSEMERRRLQEIEDDKQKMLASQHLTLQSYLIKVIVGGIEEYHEQFIKDIARSGYYGEKIRGGVPDYDLSESESLIADVRLYGAVLVYEEADISVSRGAELAGVPESAFRSHLEKQDIDVKYDPDSLDEFEGEPTL